MPPIIVADRLSKRYGTRQAVAEVSFEVAAGEVMGLLGPNGSGKTTILRLLTGYLQPSSGTAYIAGCDIRQEGLQARRSIGYVPEETPLYSHMRVAEFLAFMGRLKGLRGKRLCDRMASVCQRLSLEDRQHMLIGQLSRGYRQRVALAQALLNQPPLLILDEPTNGLDPQQIIEIRTLIGALATTHTVLITSHILSEIEKIAQRVAILLNGRLLGSYALGTGDSLPSLRLTVRGHPTTRVQACLAAVAGVISVQIEQVQEAVGVYLVQTRYPAVAESLAATLVAQGFGVLEMRPGGRDLETLFLQLTQPEVRQ
jgi:ABC-2 type transport system ATP-binding protein